MGVAHDLKAPLNAIGLNLALLRSSFQPGVQSDDERRRGHIEVVEAELARLQREVERLVAQTAPSREDVARYDLRHILEEIAGLLSPQARQHGTAIEVDLPSEPVWVRGRQDLAKQAILNVAMNGLEAACDGGRVGLSLLVSNGRTFLRVSDDGGGIPLEHRDHIFEIHFTTKEQGTGIGLYIAQSILEAEGGTLVLKESSEAGTVLELSLPLDGGQTPCSTP